MPDITDPACRRALRHAGWKIDGTREFPLQWKKKTMRIDIEAQLGAVTLLVEVKNFLGTEDGAASKIGAAIGQYLVYRDIARAKHPVYHLYLAVPHRAFRTVFMTEFGRWIRDHYAVKMLSFPYTPDDRQEVLWHSPLQP